MIPSEIPRWTGKKAVNSNMAFLSSRPFRGFLVSDGALREKNGRNKAAKKQTKITKKRKKKPEWDVSINIYIVIDLSLQMWKLPPGS